MGLPYQGNKQAIAHELVSFLKQSFKDVEHFYDLFGGGGTISEHATKHFKHVHYNELLPHVFHAVKSVHNGTCYGVLGKNEFIDRDKFKEVINSEPKNDYQFARKGLIATCWSFGNNMNNYIFGQDIEGWKKAVHDICFADSTDQIIECFRILEKRTFTKQGNYTLVFNDDKAGYLLSLPKGSERRYKLRFCVLNRVGNVPKLKDFRESENLKSLQSLERLQSLEYTNLSYERVNILPNSLLYCDIPYNSATSKNSYNVEYDAFHEPVYKWAIENKNPVVFSEYEQNVPKDFEIIWKKSKRNLAAGGTGMRSTEVLAWNKKGNFNKSTLF